MSQPDYPILGAEIARARKRLQHPLLTSKPTTMTQSVQTTLRSKGLSQGWGSIYTSLPVNVIARLTYPWNGDIQGQETFSPLSADKQTHNHDTECSNHHPSLSTLRSKGVLYIQSRAQDRAFCESRYQLKTANYICQKAPSLPHDKVPNSPPTF